MTFIFVILMMVFLAAFLGFGYFDVQITDAAPPLFASLTQAGITTTQIQTILGVAILFCQFAVILFSMLDPIGDTIKALIKPLFRLFPLLAFLAAIWNTYSPIVFSFLPSSVAQAFGITRVDNYMAQSVSNGSFTSGVLWTLGTMVVFIITTLALRRPSPDNSQVIKELRAENAKLRRQLRGGL